MQLKIHQPVLPSIAARGRSERLAETIAPVGPQGPPARRSARLVTVAARARGSLLWTTGTSCDCACNRRSFKKETACHSRAPSRQSSGTKHEGRGRLRAGQASDEDLRLADDALIDDAQRHAGPI